MIQENFGRALNNMCVAGQASDSKMHLGKVFVQMEQPMKLVKWHKAKRCVCASCASGCN